MDLDTITIGESTADEIRCSNLGCDAHFDILAARFALSTLSLDCYGSLVTGEDIDGAGFVSDGPCKRCGLEDEDWWNCPCGHSGHEVRDVETYRPIVVQVGDLVCKLCGAPAQWDIEESIGIDWEPPKPPPQAALRQIIQARDYCAEHGHYPDGTVGHDQGFDDWAADLAQNEVRGG